MHNAVHALVVEDDILVAAFIEGVLLDRDITADSIVIRKFREYPRQKHYDVAVVGIDRRSDDLSTVVHTLQKNSIPIVFFSILGDPHKLTAAFPQIPLCHYDARYGRSLALTVLGIVKASTRRSLPSPPPKASLSICR